MDEIPLFPLHTVLFPGGLLPLRIFEPRYLDMVSQCLRTDSVFGVCLIRSGSEVGEPADCHEVGTSARIVDWRRQPDGLLGITACGIHRFRVHEITAGKANLLQARIKWLPESDPAAPTPEVESLRRLAERAAGVIPGVREDAGDIDRFARLGYRLAELLPLEAGFRQHLLELEEDKARIDAMITRFPGLLKSTAAAPGTVDPETGS